jgi:hypothetical protein
MDVRILVHEKNETDNAGKEVLSAYDYEHSLALSNLP